MLPKAEGEGKRKSEFERDGIRDKACDQDWPLSPLFLILAG